MNKHGTLSSLIVILCSIFNPFNADAQLRDTVVYDYNTNSGSCVVCGGAYNCFTSSSHLLVGNSFLRLKELKIKIFHTSCNSSGNFYAVLNGDTIGSFSRSYSCQCNDCFVDSITAGTSLLNSYQQADTNDIWFGGLYVCADKIMVIRTYFNDGYNDAGISSVDSPLSLCPGSRPVSVTIGNFGKNRIDSVKVHWTWNGTAQTPYNYTGTLDTIGGSGAVRAKITLGYKSLSLGQTDTLKVWTAWPNGMADTVNYNDTARRLINTSLVDTLTVGGSNPNYTSIQAAVNDLQSKGVCGKVVINIRPGTYYEQLSIGTIPGSDSLKNITFRSSTGDSSDVLISFGSSNSSARHTLKLNSARHIRFSQLSFEATGTNYANVVDISGTFRNIRFENCVFMGYTGNSSSSNYALVTHYSTTNNGIGLYFNACDFREGSYAIYLINCSTCSGLQLSNSNMQNQKYGNTLIYYYKDILFHGNELSRYNTNYTYGYGAYFYNTGYLELMRNKIIQPKGSNGGIYLENISGNYNKRNLIANNFISAGSTNISCNAYAFYSYRSANTDFYNNSCYSASLNSGYSTLYFDRGSNIRIRNNSIRQASNGYLIYNSYSSITGISACNNNNYFAATVQYYNGNAAVNSFNAWKLASTYDSASTFSDPGYVSSTNLHAYSTDMNGVAVPDSRITTDIDLQNRSTSSPDVGADEFNLVPVDAGIRSVNSIVADSICVKVVLKNFGDDTLTAVTVNWSINGNTKTPLSWTGSLLTGKTDTICLGNYRFSKDTFYNVRSWTSSPNGLSDTMNLNDTAIRSGKPALRGIYTIGGSNPDFATFNAAITAMNDGGILDSVLFRVRSGTYSERLVIPNIRGAGRENAIVFESVNKDSSSVVLTYGTNWSEYETILLNGSQWVSFRHMTLKSSATVSPSRVVSITSGAMHIRFHRCHFENNLSSSTSTYYDPLIFINYQESDIRITKSRFIKGSSALYTDRTKDFVFTDNLIENSYYSGIYLYEVTNLGFRRNTILSNSAYSGYYGAYLGDINGPSVIEGNTITGPGISEYAGMYIDYIDPNLSTDSTYIYNNNISVGGNNAYAALYIYSPENTYIVGNNLLNYGSRSSTGYGARIRYLYNSVVYNNNFILTGNNGYAAEFYSLSNSKENFNNYYSGGSNFTIVNANSYASLSSMQSAGLDSNSLNVLPGYNSNTDLHIQNVVLNRKGKKFHFLKTDIDGEKRDSIAPDIGSDDFVPANRDAGLVAFLSPSGFIPADTIPIRVVVSNAGLDTLFSFKIRCIVNRDTLSSVSISKTLLTGDTMHVLAGNYIFRRDSVNNIRVWVYEPNNGTDQKTSNDTLKILNKRTAMSGVYTIGGSNPDFTSFRSALTAMYQAGIYGGVRFRVRSGSYTEQLRINPIPGAGDRNSVIFESETLDSSNVILRFNSAYYDSNYVVLLNGARGITFRHLTISSMNNSYGRVVQIENGASYNTFRNNIIRGISSTSTSDYLSVIVSLNSNIADEYNEFLYNLIENGSYGLHLYGYGTPDYTERGLRIEGNRLNNQYYMGMYLYYQTNPSISRNIISATAAYSSWYGMYMSDISGKARIMSNIINRRTGGNYGIYLYDVYGNSDTFLLANNIIHLGGTGSSYGIYAASYSNLHITGNTVRLANTTSSGATCLLQDYGSNLEITNNIFDNTGQGYAVYLNYPSYIRKSDNNNFRSAGSNLIRWNSSLYQNLSAYVSATGKDSNSLSEDPRFYGPDDAHIRQIALNAAGRVHPLLKTDFEGNLRDTLSPDIGADEFNPPLLDAGIFEIVNPRIPFMPDTQYVVIAIKNHGLNTLNSLNIDWTFNGTTQSSYSWTGSLASNDTAHIRIGLKYFNADSMYSVVAWSSLPNNYSDTITENDTARSLNIYPALSGTYTIGGANPDFPTFTAAVNAMIRGGIIGQVTFNVRNGTYSEKLLIPSITGAGARNSIVFQSENKDSTKVNLVNNTSGSSDNYTVRLSGASGICFRYMTISTGNTTYGRVVEMVGGAGKNTLSNNILESANVNSTSTNHAVIYIYNGNHTNNDDNHITNNVIRRGAIGIYHYGYRSTGVYDKFTRVQNNHFDNQYYMGMYMPYADSLSIIGNNFNLGSYTGTYGIYIEYGRGSMNIQRNRLYLPSGSIGIYLYYNYASAAKPTIIANNMVSVLGIYGNHGLYHYGTYANVFNNNFLLNSTGTSSNAAMFNSSSNVRSVNNIYNHAGAGYALYTNSTGSITESNYNCYRTTGTNLAYWGGNRTSLSALQSANSKDGNSISTDPQYISNSDLHVRAVALDKAGKVLAEIKTDFDGKSRDTLTPDIGADEFDIPSPDDAGISQYIGPMAPFAAGSRNVRVLLTNFGSDTLSSANIHWTMNGVTQTTYSWTGSLKTGSSDTVTIGSYNFTAGVPHSIVAWPTSPNGITDTLAYNDTLKKSKIYSALEGVYTIGGTAPDFTGFNEAATALSLGGVIDTVWFKVRNGTYTEQVQLGPYPGMTAGRPVSFTSESGDSSKVTLLYSSNNAVLSFKGADFITVSSMTVNNNYYYGGSAISISDASNDITIRNCRLLLNTNYYSSYGINSGTDKNDNIKILNNYISGAYYGILMYGGGSGQYETGTLIENNRIVNFNSAGIQIVYQNAAVIRLNTISATINSGSYLIYVSESSNDINITRNNLSTAYLYHYGIYLNNLQGSSTKKAIIANNFVSMGNPYFNGITLYNTSYVNVYYNSVHLYGTLNNSRAAALYTDGNNNLDLRNNIFSNASGGPAILTSSTPAISNYNNLYSSGTTLCLYNNTVYANLSAWRSALSRDQNSKSINPSFFSNTDLHTILVNLDSAATPISGLTEDFDGSTRNSTRPDIGADEFNSVPNNLAVTSIINPITGCKIDSQTLSVQLFNYGNLKQSGFPVRYSVNGGNVYTETFTDSLLPGTGKNFSFSGKLNTVNPGDYHIKVWTDLASDQYRLNDTIKRKISNYQIPDSVGTMIPADSTKNLAFPFSLSWTPSAGAVNYDIYIWADTVGNRPNTPFFSNVSQISRQISGNLGYGVTYKWQVVAKNPSCYTDGPVQRFTIRHLPDLTISGVSAPSSTYSGNNISVSWNVKNNGVGGTGSSNWYDLIYLSMDQTLDNGDLQLTGVQNFSSLNPNQSYSNSVNVTLPEGISNTYYIIVRTDMYSNLTESNEGNNIRSSSGMIVSLTPPPDLQVTALAKPTKRANSGQTLNISYTVKNVGSGNTRSSSW